MRESSEMYIKVIQVGGDGLEQGGGEKEITGGAKVCRRSNLKPFLDV